jgi:hypothetical protein
LQVSPQRPPAASPQRLMFRIMRMLVKAFLASHLLPPAANDGLPQVVGLGLPLVTSAGTFSWLHDQTWMPFSVHSVASRTC